MQPKGPPQSRTHLRMKAFGLKEPGLQNKQCGREAHVHSGFNTPLPHPAKALPSLALATRRAQGRVNPTDSSVETRSAAAAVAGGTLRLPGAIRAGKVGAAEAGRGPPGRGLLGTTASGATDIWPNLTSCC